MKQVGPHHLSDSILLCPHLPHYRNGLTYANVLPEELCGGLPVHANAVNSMMPPCRLQFTARMNTQLEIYTRFFLR